MISMQEVLFYVSKIGCHKLAELPGVVLGLGNDFACLPLGEEFVYLSLAIEIQPEKDRTCVAVGHSEGAIGGKNLQYPHETPGTSTGLDTQRVSRLEFKP
jgi:hypothetical protein